MPQDEMSASILRELSAIRMELVRHNEHHKTQDADVKKHDATLYGYDQVTGLVTRVSNHALVLKTVGGVFGTALGGAGLFLLVKLITS